MEFKHYKATEFNEIGKEATRRLANGEFRDAVEKEQLEVDKERHEIWMQVRGVTGENFNVATEGVESNVVAFIDMGTKQKYLNIAFLTRENLTDAIHAGVHECVHDHSGVCGLDFKNKVQTAKLQAIESKLGVKGLASTEDLHEGFTEEVTAKKQGKEYANTGYKKQVAVAKALEVASKKTTGKSVRDMFENAAGDTTKIVENISQMGDVVLLREALSALSPVKLRRFMGPSALSNNEVESELKNRIKNAPPPVNNAWEAELALKKMVSEIVAEKRIRGSLKQVVNFDFKIAA